MLKSLKFQDIIIKIAEYYIDEIYGDYYTELVKSKEFILTELNKEIQKFEKTINLGIKEFDKVVKKLNGNNIIDGEASFRLYDTFGFPVELTEELAKEQ